MYYTRFKVHGAAPQRYSVVRGYGKHTWGEPMWFEYIQSYSRTLHYQMLMMIFRGLLLDSGLVSIYIKRGYFKVILKTQWFSRGYPSKKDVHISHDSAYTAHAYYLFTWHVFRCPFPFLPHTHTQKPFPRTFPFGESHVKHQNALIQWLQWGLQHPFHYRVQLIWWSPGKSIYLARMSLVWRNHPYTTSQ